ncbi:MAG: EamA family transporter [Anaerolinea sp.]|nr:EamA family transporter [Anaerolinea sp.]
MKRIVGIGLIVISAASFGTLPIIGRFAYADGMDVTTMLFLRFTIASLLMLAWMAIRKEPLPRGRTLLQLAGMGGLGYVGQSFSFMSAIQYASTGLVALLLYLYPVFVSILSVIFLKARLTPKKMLALGLATAGAALTANPQGGQLPGILLAISAAAIYAVYIIVGTGVMQKATAIQSSTIIFASAALVFGGLTAARGPHWPATGGGWLAVAAIAVVATIIPVATFLAGLKIIGPTDASLLSTLEPVVTVALAALILSESVQPVMLLGGGLILAAVLLTVNHKQKSMPG